MIHFYSHTTGVRTQQCNRKSSFSKQQQQPPPAIFSLLHKFEGLIIHWLVFSMLLLSLLSVSLFDISQSCLRRDQWSLQSQLVSQFEDITLLTTSFTLKHSIHAPLCLSSILLLAGESLHQPMTPVVSKPMFWL